jgi:hypothetical protein
VPRLERLAGSRFGTTWVDPATNRLHVGLADDRFGLAGLAVRAAALALPEDVRGHVEIETVPRSEADLLALVGPVRAALPAEVPAIIGITAGARLGVTVPSDAGVAATVRRVVPADVLDLHLVDRSAFEAVHGSRQEYPPIEAGLRISLVWGGACTAGPLYANGFGFFTATDGHCGGIVMNSRTGRRIGPVASNLWNTVGDGGRIEADALLASTNADLTDDLYLGPGVHRDVDAEIPNAFQFAGVQVWVSRGQGDRVDAATITCAAPCLFSTLGPLDGTVRTITNGACATIAGIGGDSGSPVYRPNGDNAAIAGILSNAAGCYSTSTGIRTGLGAVLVTWL